MKKQIILFDGLCHFCNSWIRLILRGDKQNKFDLISLHTEKGKLLLKKAGFSEHFLDSVILIEGNRAFIKSDAVLKIITSLNGIWKLAKVCYLIPLKFRNYFYDLIASKRYLLNSFDSTACELSEKS